jgi:hypothetical protein
MMGQIKKYVDTAKIEQVAELPQRQQREFGMRLIAEAEPACETGRPIVDLHATEDQFKVMAAALSSSFRQLAESSGADEAEIACVSETMGHLPKETMIELGNSSRAHVAALYRRELEKCISP